MYDKGYLWGPVLGGPVKNATASFSAPLELSPGNSDGVPHPQRRRTEALGILASLTRPRPLEGSLLTIARLAHHKSWARAGRQSRGIQHQRSEWLSMLARTSKGKEGSLRIDMSSVP